MGTIKDINDLTIQLIKSVKDRDIVAKIVTIQSLISTVQSENSTLHSKNLELNKTILDLEKKIFNLEKEVYGFKQKQKTPSLQSKYVFDETYGIYKSKETGHYFCTSCLLNNIESPLTERPSGWRCESNDCKKIYPNPSYKAPKRENPYKNYFKSR